MASNQMIESPIYLRDNNILGIITTSDNNNKKAIVLLLNAGVIHRVGPNRLYVKLARKISEVGYTVCRFDFSGIGDSKNESYTEQSFQENAIIEAKQVMDQLSRELNIDRFILIGLCLGADLAFKISLVDKRIAGIVTINGEFFEEDKIKKVFSKANKKIIARYYKKHLFDITRWYKLISGKNKMLKKVLESIFTYLTKIFKVKSIHVKTKINNDTVTGKFPIDNWKKLLTQNIKILHIFSEGSIALDIFYLTNSKEIKNIKSDNLEIKVLNNIDHTFTPIWAQELLISCISNWMYSLKF